jgi:hypothetical protein
MLPMGLEADPANDSPAKVARPSKVGYTMRVLERGRFMTTPDWPALRLPVVGALIALALALAGWFVTRGPHDEFATLSGHRDGVFSLALTPGGTGAASGGGDGAVRLWDLPKQRLQTVLKG